MAEKRRCEGDKREKRKQNCLKTTFLRHFPLKGRLRRKESKKHAEKTENGKGEAENLKEWL